MAPRGVAIMQTESPGKCPPQGAYRRLPRRYERRYVPPLSDGQGLPDRSGEPVRACGKLDDEANTAILSGMVDMRPADPIEGIPIGQIIAANEAALKMHRLAWAQPPECFEARMKYLAQADKGAYR